MVLHFTGEKLFDTKTVSVKYLVENYDDNTIIYGIKTLNLITCSSGNLLKCDNCIFVSCKSLKIQIQEFSRDI